MMIGRGAEAILEKKGDKLIKKRVSKGYRLKNIDLEIRKDRTKKETRVMLDAKRHGIKVPIIFSKDLENMTIEMEYLKGPVLRDKLDKLSSKKQKQVCKNIGEIVAKLHKSRIMHGDLTTSNIILKDNDINNIYLIDFGLGFISPRIEDMAVDIHLIKRALLSKHNKIWKSCFKTIIQSYSKELGKEKSEKVLERMEKVEKRGRYTDK